MLLDTAAQSRRRNQAPQNRNHRLAPRNPNKHRNRNSRSRNPRTKNLKLSLMSGRNKLISWNVIIIYENG